MIGDFVFLHSYQFLSSSLDALMNNLKHKPNNEVFAGDKQQDCPQIYYKEIYPCEYMDS